jgi:putative ABC transport system permease protein
MTYLDCIRAALRSLRVNVLRSVLTALGIIIGVAAVIAMVAVGAGAESRVQGVIQSLGSNLLVVLPGSTTSGGVRQGSGSLPTLTESDAKAIGSDIPAVTLSAPTVRGTAQLIAGNLNWYTSVQGVTPAFLDVREWPVASGRVFTDNETRAAAKVVLLGKTVVANLFAGQDPVGQTIRIQRVPFEVIGVLDAKGQTPFGSDQDDTVMVPISTAKLRLLGGRKLSGDLVGNITVKAQSSELVSEAEQGIKTLLRERHRLRDNQPDDFSIRNLSQMLEARAESTRVMTILLASVAGVSLIVGGIGIMNIMLVSVTERTREIGLRMAIGAESRDIMSQFVIEAVALSLIGGLIGIVLGIGASLAIAQLADWPMLIQPEAVLIAVGFAGAVGVFFGFYPARKAAQLDPIEALRYE